MSNYIDPMSAVSVSTLIATDIQATALGVIPAREELAQVVSEVQLQTQILGSSLLHITLIDPGWAIQRTGWLNVSPDGLLDEIEVEFPKGSGMWWRLAMVEGGNNLSAPNLTLTFQDRIVAYLQDKAGKKVVAPGTTTRAQFIKQLVDEVGNGDGKQPIQFVCPEVNQLQLVNEPAGASTGSTGPQAAHAKLNKLPGVTNKGLLTPGQITFTQQLNLKTRLDPAVVAAWCLSEESNTAAIAREAANNSNWLNVGPGQVFSNGPVDGANQTARFLQSGGSPSIRAILKTAGQTPMAQLSAIWMSNWDGNAHYNNGANLRATYQEVTGVTAPGQALTGTGAVSTTAPSDVSQLARGTSDNPDENSWDCGLRLASDVQWSLFSNGNILYYMDGPTLAAQPPAAYLRLDDAGTTWTVTNPADGDTATDIVSNLQYTFDNTAFGFSVTHKRKGRTQRRTGVRTPQTPARVKLNMICGALDYFAGDVFVFQNSGVIDGRWIVEDATRNCVADRHTQFTLGPPVLPNLEPAGPPAKPASTTSKPGSGQAPTQKGTTGNARTPPTPATTGVAGIWYPPAQRLYTAKLDHGPRGSTSGIVIHVNAGQGDTYPGVVSGFAAGGFVPGVGAHFEIGSQQDGPVVQFLPLDRVAWHAGNANGFSIGIEHAGLGASRQEWISGHGNMLTTSATLAGWLLKTCKLGPPVINTTDVTPVRPDGSPKGNIWPHNLGLLGGPSWGGHTCPDGPDNVDYFPWDVWGLMVDKAYNLTGPGVQAVPQQPSISPRGVGGPSAPPPGVPSLWNPPSTVVTLPGRHPGPGR